jgi:hypothetical protein
MFPAVTGNKATLKEQNEVIFKQLKEIRGLSDAQILAIRKIFEASGYIGQGNPDVTKHPVSEEECRAKLEKEKIHYENARYEKICGGNSLRISDHLGEGE